MYVSFTLRLRLSHPGSREIRVLPEMLRVIDVLTCVINTQTRGINGFNLLRHWSCSCCPATCQRACVNQKRPMSRYCTAVLRRSYRQRRDTELTTVQCLRVICGCRTVQTNSAETPLALLAIRSYCHNII